MRAVGLITEYNPFHNGHLHHLQESLRVSGAEVAVAVMSGHFLQRGEPALVDKWVRAEMALAAGVDLVLELPLPFACNSARHFADGAVRLFDALGVESLCFGSEAGQLAPLQRCAELLVEQSALVCQETARQLHNGVDYPTARAALVTERFGMDATALATPNNILGVEYLRALREQHSPVHPCTIPRLGVGYHDLLPVGAIASATALRRMLSAGEDLFPLLPSAVHPPLQQAFSAGFVLDETKFFSAVSARLLHGPATLAGLYQFPPGLGERLYQAALTSRQWDELVSAGTVRHLTRTRVQRLLCYALLGLAAARMESFLAAGPRYLRLLASSRRGERYLATTRKDRSLPLLGNLSRAQAVLKRHFAAGTEQHRLAEGMLQTDLLATRLYGLFLRNTPEGHRNRDYFEEVRRPQSVPVL